MMLSHRCHFSPMANTGQKFIYTGCAKGRVVIYDMLTGKEVSQSDDDSVMISSVRRLCSLVTVAV